MGAWGEGMKQFLGRQPAGLETNGIVEDEALNQRGAIRWLIGCGIVLIAMIAIGTAFMVSSYRDRAIRNAGREAERTVVLLARHFDQELGDFTAVQTAFAAKAKAIASPDQFRRETASYETYLSLKARLEGATDATGVNVYDSEGILTNTSERFPAPLISIADRHYFQVLKSSPSQLLAVELLRSRVTGRVAVLIARKIVGAGGAFLGVIIRGFDPVKFEQTFASAAPGPDAAILAFDQDSNLLARFPHVEGLMGKKLSTAPLFAKQMSGKDHDTSRIISPIDGQERLVSVRRLDRFPLYVTVTTTVAAALSDWRTQTRTFIATAGLIVLVIVCILFLIVRQMSRQHRSSERRLALQKLRLDTAVEHMSQGLTLFDGSERLVVCNQRYLEIFGLPADRVRPGHTLREVMAVRMQAASRQGETLEQLCSRIRENVALGKVVIAQAPNGRSIQITHRRVDGGGGGWVTTHEDITDRKLSEDRIAYLAHYDALTGLPNRVLFQEQLEQELNRVRRSGQIALLYIDIDEFKSVNDSLGHPIGDELLKGIAARLRGCIRETDLIARLGGDEFAIVQTATENPSDVTDLVSRIYEALRASFDCLGHRLVTDASIGIALAPQDASESDQLLKNADLALYGAKADGRRTYRFFEPSMDARAKARLTMERDLRQAMLDGGFDLQYQPLLSLSSNEVTGCEALLRWRHPERGMVSPAEFIPVAEDTGLIGRLGEWVFTTACTEAASWPDHVKIAVNVSPVQFKSPGFALKVAAALSSAGLRANRLELEITEAVLIRDDEATLTILHQLRALGVRIALDDFGTGYSSLSYLQRFPFDKIKIDRCFVSGLSESDGSPAIVRAVVDIAAERHMTTTAEGVETEQQRELLRALGCTEMQGYLFSRPRPVAEIRTLLSQSCQTAAA
jgi:diguanylate cyclase (GGDEF)-like protein/PAS domain S-box-containing protein